MNTRKTIVDPGAREDTRLYTITSYLPAHRQIADRPASTPILPRRFARRLSGHPIECSLPAAISLPGLGASAVDASSYVLPYP